VTFVALLVIVAILDAAEPSYMNIIPSLLEEKYGKILFSERTSEINTVVIHAISAINVYPQEPFSVEHCMKILSDNGVSSHYIIDRSGKIYLLVQEEKKAWHAGVSQMPPPDNRKNVNDFSIGIELIGNEIVPFEEEQYLALNFLLSDIKKRYDVKYILGHQHIATKKLVEQGLRKDVKWDPGKQFEWNKIIQEKQIEKENKQ
jgi:N-acetyl-anhydromuramyl-L-alanine amidase AmpD